jgi:hypothetical protein
MEEDNNAAYKLMEELLKLIREEKFSVAILSYLLMSLANLAKMDIV